MVITVTISAPASAVKGAWFNISGIVMDNGEPLSYVDVYLYYNGTLLAVTQTGVDGDYLEPCRIYTAGNWTLRAFVDIDGTGEDTRPITIVEIPTVTTQAATGIDWDDGTFHATFNGTITATGYQNCSQRGFNWGYASGTYPYTTQEFGSFGTGAFDAYRDGMTAKVYFRAYAINDAGTGYGSERSFDPPPLPPDPPTNVQASDGTYSDKVRITWTKSEGATGYQVYRNGTPLGWLGDVALFDDTGAGAPSISGGNAVASDGVYAAYVFLSLSGTGTNNGTTHTYKVKARNAAGESGYSGTNTGYRGPGSLNYQWYRSAGDSDAGYSSISGATSSTYSDTGAPAPTITPGTAAASDGTYSAYVRLTLEGESANIGAGRYYKCWLTAAGCSSKYSGSNRGYRGVGSLNYQWKRSAADSDADYSNITGATYEPYNDTGAPANGDGRYYKCYLTATGASAQYSNADRGYRAPMATMIGGPTGWDWGTPVADVSIVPITSDGGLTWSWGVATGTITIPDGGPTSWSWEEHTF